MGWTEAVLNCGAYGADALCERLEALGVGGMVMEDERDFRDFLENNRQYWDYVDEELERRFTGVSRVRFYLSDDREGKALLDRIRADGLSPVLRPVEDSDWENNWKQYYKPLEIGERLIVVPEWEETPAAGRLPLRLDPGLIFGTGSHATTRMCLCALESLAGPGKRVLDLGCGSGILGIGALVLGCASCTGCDIDPKAPNVAVSNAALNGLGSDRFTVCAGDVLADAGLRSRLGGGYDVILANIVADVIIPLAGLARAFMAEGAAFVCSGILEGRQAEVERALHSAGFAVTEHRGEEEWHCYTCR
jgi:ribosomal protein L11 methyltransferase